MNILARLLLILLAALPVSPVTAAGWYSKTPDGGVVTVDPDTNRATLNRNGVTTPLWDGAHRMQDGSVLIIKQGIAVPNQAVIDARQLPPPEMEDVEGWPIAGYSPCEQLVRRVCGKQDQCAVAEACGLARQLLDMELGERETSASRSRMTYTSGQCLKAIADSGFFRICPRAETAEND